MPLVLAAKQKRDVEQEPEEESPAESDQHGHPLIELRDVLRPQNIRPSCNTGSRSDINISLRPEKVKKGHLKLRGEGRHGSPVKDLSSSGKALVRTAELVLKNSLVGVLDERDVVKPDPVWRDPAAGDEEAAEEEEVGEKGDYDGVRDHEIRDGAGEKCDEGVGRPEGGDENEDEEAEAR